MSFTVLRAQSGSGTRVSSRALRGRKRRRGLALRMRLRVGAVGKFNGAMDYEGEGRGVGRVAHSPTHTAQLAMLPKKSECGVLQLTSERRTRTQTALPTQHVARSMSRKSAGMGLHHHLRSVRCVHVRACVVLKQSSRGGAATRMDKGMDVFHRSGPSDCASGSMWDTALESGERTIFDAAVISLPGAGNMSRGASDSDVSSS
jgi:hypothetical protein